MSKTTRLLCILALLAAFSVTFAACGRDNNGTDDSNNYGTQESDAAEVEVEVETLTILAPESHRDNLVRARGHTRSALQGQGRDFHAEITTYRFEELHDVMMRKRTMLMAGHGYDIFFWEPSYSMLPFARSGFLTDIYTLIDNCPSTSRDDFFTNALDAFAIEGRLYAFPLNFQLSFVGINSELPQEFIDRFAGYNSISFVQLIQFYTELQNMQGGDFTHLDMISVPWFFYSPEFMVRHETNNFINFDTNVSNLYDAYFVSYLENLQRMRQNRLLFNWNALDATQGHIPFMTNAESRQRAGAFMFSYSWYLFNQIHALTQHEDDLFLHAIPLSDVQGRLRMQPGPVVYITRAGNASLAWEYIQRLTNVSVPHGDNNSPTAVPIRRDLFYSHFSGVIEFIFDSNLRDHALGRNFDNVIPRFEQYAKMPMSPPPFVPINLIEDHVDMLLRGVLTPEEAAHRINNAVSLWLIE